MIYSGSRSHTFNGVKYGIMQLRFELFDVLNTNITSVQNLHLASLSSRASLHTNLLSCECKILIEEVEDLLREYTK